MDYRSRIFLKGVENSHRKPCSDYQLMINPLGFMPNLSMRGVDNSIDNEEMLSARLQPFRAAPLQPIHLLHCRDRVGCVTGL
jgi:hypothetical protein